MGERMSSRSARGLSEMHLQDAINIHPIQESYHWYWWDRGEILQSACDMQIVSVSGGDHRRIHNFGFFVTDIDMGLGYLEVQKRDLWRAPSWSSAGSLEIYQNLSQIQATNEFLVNEKKANKLRLAKRTKKKYGCESLRKSPSVLPMTSWRPRPWRTCLNPE